MAVEKIHDRGQTLQAPTGKVLGIADTRADVDKAAKALAGAGFKKVEVLCGDDGVRLLERIDMFFFSDMEDRVLARHLEELKAGNMVIAIETPSERVDEATEIAAQNGIRRLIHFGSMAITWLTK
jgi:hypothetical protein